MLRDEKEPNDVASEPHEYTHILDALRGFCTMRQLPSTEPSKAVDPQHSFIKKENKTVESTVSAKIDNTFLNY